MSARRSPTTSRHVTLVAAHETATPGPLSPLRAAIMAVALGGCVMAAVAWSTLPLRGRDLPPLAAAALRQP